MNYDFYSVIATLNGLCLNKASGQITQQSYHFVSFARCPHLFKSVMNRAINTTLGVKHGLAAIPFVYTFFFFKFYLFFFCKYICIQN